MENIEYNGDAGKFIEKLNTSRKSRTLSKNLLGEGFTDISPDDLDRPLETGRYNLVYSQTRFQFFFNDEDSEYMYVFLNGKDSTGSAFQRWSWCKGIRSLVVRDPFCTMTGSDLGWYIGTKRTDYRELTAEVIGRISKTYGIPDDRIVIYGSSGGGTASVFMGNYIPGCTVVSINPQIDVRSLKTDAALFSKKTGMDLSPKTCERNDFKKAVRTRKCRILFIINCLDEYGFKELADLVLSQGLTPKYGLNRTDDLAIWVYQASSSISPQGKWLHHTSSDIRTVFTAIDEIVRNWDGKDLEDDILLLTELWYEYYLEKHRAYAFRSILDSDKDPWAKLRIACMYEDGDYFEKDLSKAAELLSESTKMSKDIKLKRLRAEFYTKHPELILADNPDSILKLPFNVEQLVSIGRMMRKMNHDGPRLEIAVKCLRKARSLGNTWVYKELCDLLWSLKTPEADAEMISILSSEADKKKSEAIGRLAKAYLNGRGVEKDVDKAKELFVIASKSEPKWKAYLK